MEKVVTYNRLEAAAKLGVALITVDRALAARTIGHFRVGTRVLFSDAHLAAFLARDERQPKEARHGK